MSSPVGSRRHPDEMKTNWFKETFGFLEARGPRGYDRVRSKFRVSHDDRGAVTLMTLPFKDKVGREFHVGRFKTPTLSELRSATEEDGPRGDVGRGSPDDGNIDGGLSFRHVVANAADLHRDPARRGSVFQVASQFNCLEMARPDVRPEDGVTKYERDFTQGPTCAISCPAGTVYRNYFVNGTGQGGGDGRQIDLLEDVGVAVGNTNPSVAGGANKYWKMQNGYALSVTESSIRELSAELRGNEARAREAMRSLRVGVHWDTEVARPPPAVPVVNGNDAIDSRPPPHTVAQVYCSALPVGHNDAYGKAIASDWEPFAHLVLDGLYEATLAVGAILARQRGERVSVYLTKVGGGVFGNEPSWISGAIQRALHEFRDHPLDIYLVHYRVLEGHYVNSLGPIGGDAP